MSLESTHRQPDTDAGKTAHRDAIRKSGTEAQSSNLHLLPDMKEQVSPQYITSGDNAGHFKITNIFDTSAKPTKLDGPSEAPRTQAQIADACWTEPEHKANDMKIGRETRHQVIDSLINQLKARYVNPESIEKAEQALRLKEQSQYTNIDSAEEFARSLTHDLRSILHDKHLGVFFDEKALPADFNKTPPEAMDRQLRQQVCERSGVEAVQALEGNIGYLQLTGFFPSNSGADPRAVELTKQAIDSAMSRLADKDALIIDLRNNTGGDPHTVLRTLNHLLEAGTTVNKIHWREGTSTRIESLVTENPNGPKFGSQKPIYLLTSDKTFSAGEEFAYDLQALGRAKVVGGVTGGGANPTYAFRLTDNFGAAIPTGQSINPSTGKNWERTGVQPDITVPPEQALEVAKAMLLLELGKKE
jgi:hypothetical protein